MPSRDALQRLVDGLQMLVREHLALARAELKDDLRAMGRDALAGAAGVLPAGYLLFMAAIALLLATWIPAWAGLGIVALVNLAVGGAVTRAGVRRLMKSRVDSTRTGEELQRDKQWIASLRENSVS